MDLKWDLRRGLPFPDDSVEAIFSEYVWEHIPLEGGLALMRDCRRVLRPEGVMRVGVPGAGRYMRSYAGLVHLIDQVKPGLPTRARAVNEHYYYTGHGTMYHEETLVLALEETGFKSIQAQPFGLGRLGAVDSEDRRLETLYVEAIK